MNRQNTSLCHIKFMFNVSFLVNKSSTVTVRELFNPIPTNKNSIVELPTVITFLLIKLQLQRVKLGEV